jgi:hypothetical protein
VTSTGLLFLRGADMDPTRLRAARPEAKFVARARLAESGKPGVWGILVEAPLAEADAALPLRPVATDDGRSFAARADEAPSGDPAAVLAAARYWELPPAYVRSLPGGETAPEMRYELIHPGSGGSSDPSLDPERGEG